MSDSQQAQAAELIETFDMLGDWEEKYRFIIDLGRQMPTLPEEEKTDANKVSGCLSSVWVIARSAEADGEQVIEFLADSDSAIVRGLVAMLRSVYSGQTPRDIVAFDIDGLFERLQLGQHLSMGRRNGLSEMVRRIKTLAAAEAA